MSPFCDYIALGLDAALTLYLLHLHQRDCKTIDNIKEAPSLDIGSDLISLVNDSPNQTLPFAVIRGQVAEINGTIESSTGAKGVLQVNTIHEIANRKIHAWETDNRPPLSESRNSVEFGLSQISDSSEPSSFIVEVKNPFDSLWESLLLPCSSCFIPKNTSISSSVMGGLANSKAFGIRKTEKFLPLGAIVTGIGEVVKHNETGNFILQEPSGSTQPYILTALKFDEFMNKLEFKKRLQRVLILSTMTVGLAIFGKRVYSWWKQNKLEKLREKILKERTSINLEDLCRCQTCLVCLINPREVILVECGHVAICADCVLKVNGLCPICREPIFDTRKAYIA